jgi:hypothetical protein
MANNSRETPYIDMDNVLVDFSSGVARLPERLIEAYGAILKEVPDIFHSWSLCWRGGGVQSTGPGF